MQQPLRIAISACFFHPDFKRPTFTGKTLLYAEESLLRFVMQGGALPYMVPNVLAPLTLDILLQDFDGLILQGGVDVCPKTYGEEPLKPEWSGDPLRDAYEIQLLKHFMQAQKPVLGICRGLQLINVALGGTLYQDIQTQMPHFRQHRHGEKYDQWFHTIEIFEQTTLAKIYPEKKQAHINSVHHQAIKDLGKNLQVEARSTDDGIIEAISSTEHPFVYGVQWHPEFQTSQTTLLEPQPLLQHFLNACRKKF